jgi:hypothetical protein
VAFTPSWANDGGGAFALPTNPARIEEFMQAATKRYPDIHVGRSGRAELAPVFRPRSRSHGWGR